MNDYVTCLCGQVCDSELAIKIEYQNNGYMWFCSQKCKKHFERRD
jgi:YHS domain-containing protein